MNDNDNRQMNKRHAIMKPTQLTVNKH